MTREIERLVDLAARVGDDLDKIAGALRPRLAALPIPLPLRISGKVVRAA